MNDFAVRDVESDSELRFTGSIPHGLVGYDGCTFMVALNTQALKASVVVYDIQPERWALFFIELAEHWRGWQGQKTHESLEHHLRLVATSDRTGHITLRAFLRGIFPFDWRAESYLTVEAGQLESIAAGACRYFGDNCVQPGTPADPLVSPPIS